MTPKETFMARLCGDGSERTPVFLRDLTLALDVIDARTTDVFTSEYDHKLSARAIIEFQRMTEQDAVVGCIQSAAFNVESFGGTMKYPEYGIPVPLTHPFQGLTELPDDISTDVSGKMKGAVRSYSEVRRRLSNVAVVGNIEGPLTKAGTLIGMDDLAMRISENDGMLRNVLDISIEHSVNYVDELNDDGSVDAVFIASATDNPDLFGPTAYGDIVVKRLKGMVDDIHGMGLPVIFHPHGSFDGLEHLFQRTIETDIDGLQFSEGNDPGTMTEWIDGRCAVLGGTDIVPTLYSGSDDLIRSETERYLNACSAGRHIFMPSCSLHRGTDIRRLNVMLNAVGNYESLK